MANTSQIELLVERVERLLLRYDELQRTNELLGQHVQALTLERDALKSRLSAVRARVDGLLDRLPIAEAKAEVHGASDAVPENQS